MVTMQLAPLESATPAVPPPQPDTTAADVTEEAHPKFADDAATRSTPPRVIDENTDMTTLTDHEIMQLMEGIGEEDVVSKVGSHHTTRGMMMADWSFIAPDQRARPAQCHSRRIQEWLERGFEEDRLVAGEWVGSGLESERGRRLFLPV